MTLSGPNVTNHIDGLTFQEEVFDQIIRTSYVLTPFFSSHYKPIGKLPQRNVWLQQGLTQGKLTLSAQHTSGSGTLAVDAGNQYFNPTVLLANNYQLSLNDGSLIFSVTGYNSDKTTLNVTVVYGSDTTIASGTEIRVTSAVEEGSDTGADNYLVTSTSDINYFSNKMIPFRTSKLVENGGFTDIGVNELTQANQMDNAFVDIMNQIEFDCFKSPKVAGTNAATRQGNTISAGMGARAGGYCSYISSTGGYAPTTASVLSYQMLRNDLRTIINRGAFADMEPNSEKTNANATVYCSRTMLGYFNQMFDLERHQTIVMPQQFGGKVGTWHTETSVEGISLTIKPTTALTNTEYVIEPRPDLNEIQVKRLFEEVARNPYEGDNIKTAVSTTWSGRYRAPWLSVHRTNILAP